MRRAVVTGANRGLGLEFVRQLLAAGDEVIGTARDVGRAGELEELVAASGGRGRVVALDAADPASVAAAGQAVASRFDRVDLLINNAGIMTDPNRPVPASAGALAELDPDAVLEVLRVNTVGPLAVTQAVAPLLRSGSVVVNMSSGMGSIAGAASPGYIAYCMSKAALNMATRQLAAGLGPESAGPAGVTVVSISPGWVATDMGGPGAPLDPPESVKGILSVVAGLTPADSGSFLERSGNRLEW